MYSDNAIRQAANKIADAHRPVSFTGAGLSAESGIATFRGNSDAEALWSSYDPQRLASQEGFLTAPATVIDWYNWRRKTLSKAKPNSAHRTLAELEGWAHITQNVDNLLEVAGADPDRVYHLHGSLLEDHCNANCGYSERIELHNAPALRRCHCGAFMRPSVVWFGESLPNPIFNTALEEAANADLMLVVGTSARVYPAASLIDLAVRNNTDVIVVNTEPSVVATEKISELVGPAGEVLPQLVK